MKAGALVSVAETLRQEAPEAYDRRPMKAVGLRRLCRRRRMGDIRLDVPSEQEGSPYFVGWPQDCDKCGRRRFKIQSGKRREGGAGQPGRETAPSCISIVFLLPCAGLPPD